MDTIIRNGIIADGTGAPLYTADIAIKGDKIIEIGKLCERPTLEEIQDGRSGSILLRPSQNDNTITIDLRVEESGDLIDWQPTERTLSGTFPLSGNKKFYRFSLTE